MSPVFKKLDKWEIIPIGYQRVNWHIIFDVKMEYFRRKSRLVAGGHVIEPPSTIIYVSVVLKKTVLIELKLAELNDLPVKVMDIQNSYITTPVIEKIWTVMGLEFGEDSGRKAIVVCSIYGLKISGSAFRNHFSDCMHHLVFLPCTADLYLWMKPFLWPDDGFNYYAYVLIYVENVMVIHHDIESVLWRIDKYFKLKPSPIGDAEIYLGFKLKKMRLYNGVWAWENIPARYVKELVVNVDNYLDRLADVSWQFPKKES